MCENSDILSKTAVQRLNHSKFIKSQELEGRLEVDEVNAYLGGKAISKELWRRQAFEMGLPADVYLDIAALATDESGTHKVKYGGQTYLVEVNGIVPSEYGPHREIKSLTIYPG